ncbi:4'-phosphopantetheinyl transferase family protein [Hahella ganghwensis]|uniref:4'-phosphopantetheinyl transferase family protein n=1 Tax=Hahella ganghwensis TaxID=286420 RepID=UPI00035C2737|nr:4'-phosphopantetheinyl transferase superfamily protein [Hahella ganghwensis]
MVPDVQVRVFNFIPGELEDLASSVLRSKTPETVLPASDFAQLARYRTTETQAQYILSRRFLRDLLVELSDDPQYLHAPITRTPEGKPELTDNSIFFNLSHTENAIAVIASLKGHCGIDVQSTDKKLSYDKLAAKLLSKQELEIYAKQPFQLRESLFLRLFTLKEAYSKLQGKGLAMKFSTIDFSNRLTDVARHAHGELPAGNQYKIYYRWERVNLAFLCQKNLNVNYKELSAQEYLHQKIILNKIVQ